MPKTKDQKVQEWSKLYKDHLDSLRSWGGEYDEASVIDFWSQGVDNINNDRHPLDTDWPLG